MGSIGRRAFRMAERRHTYRQSRTVPTAVRLCVFVSAVNKNTSFQMIVLLSVSALPSKHQVITVPKVLVSDFCRQSQRCHLARRCATSSPSLIISPRLY